MPAYITYPLFHTLSYQLTFSLASSRCRAIYHHHRRHYLFHVLPIDVFDMPIRNCTYRNFEIDLHLLSKP